MGLRVQPAISAAQFNRAQALRELGREQEALHGMEIAVRVDPSFATGYESLGETHLQEGRLTQATEAFVHMASLRPDATAAYYSLGKAYFAARRLSELMPTFAEALSNVGTSLKESGRHDEAARTFQLAIRAKPTLCEAYKNLGSSYGEINGRLPEAVGAFEGALRINPQFWPSLYALLDTKQFLCDWRGRHGLMHKLSSHLEDLHTRRELGAGPDERMHGGLAPFQTLAMPLSPSTRLAVTHNRARREIAHAAATRVDPPLRWSPAADVMSAHEPAKHPKPASLRLGLISSDFGDHPVGHAMLPWLQALQSRPALDVICFASDSVEKRHAGTELRRELAASCASFYDLTELSDSEATHAINEQRVHVLLNLVGHTAGARHVITQWQPAPVQGLHYGYPATTALPAMAYMQVDRVATPPSLRRDFTERLAYFPYCHFVAVHASRYPHVHRVTGEAEPWDEQGRGRRADSQRLVRSADGSVVRRSDLGLGASGMYDDAFALCNFNQLYKMDPETFEAWTNTLRRVPRSFLWLTRVSVRKDTSLYAEQHLLHEARAAGVRSGRLAFSFRFPETDYVAYRALADLMVDNRAYNAHTTGADTLWAGVPAVFIEGHHLAGRAGTSFASAVGGASMVAPSMRGYEDTTHQLGTRPSQLHHLRRQLMAMRETAPFFDLQRLAKAQHRLASLMWGVYAAGYLPMHVIAAR